MIGAGQQAPDFELVSHLAGTKFYLSQFKGQKNVMLPQKIRSTKAAPRTEIRNKSK